uniref:MADF domain-containing protein n=1 Tax=Acrobeloides nanus TaxID=290746 RepID=A0A914ENI7_9BILA
MGESDPPSAESSKLFECDLNNVLSVDDHEPSFNLRLIDAVRQSRCLYDASDRQYRSADYKIKVWNRLVQHLNFQGDARTLYNRWKQLRDKYGKEKKKMKYNGNHTTWQYFKHLTFLDPHMVDRTQQKFRRTKDGKIIIVEPARPVAITDPNFYLNLIHEVRQQPCLFDIHDPKYRHTESRNLAWANIIRTLKFQGDINAIYKQWKKLRDRYVREKRKMRMSNNGEQEQSSWELFNEMIWMDPYLDERAALVKRKRETDDSDLDEMYLEDYQTSSRNIETPQYTMVIPQTVTQQIAASHTSASILNKAPQIHTNVTSNNSGIQATTSRQVRTLPTTLLSNGTTVMLQQPIQHTQQVIIANEGFDGDRAFSLSVAADLRALPEHARNMARAQIQHLLENSKITIVKG